MLAETVRHVRPAELAEGDVLILEHGADDSLAGDALAAAEDTVLAAIAGAAWPVQRLRTRVARQGARAAGSGRRLTAQDVASERLARMTAQDPVLAEAIRALDLEMLD
jgi:hypothetical protein